MARKALRLKTEKLQTELLKSIKAGKAPKRPTKVYNRCKICGRRRGFLRKFEVCRICFRERASWGQTVGVRKSSW